MNYKVGHAMNEQPSGVQSCGEAWDMDVRREARGEEREQKSINNEGQEQRQETVRCRGR